MIILIPQIAILIQQRLSDKNNSPFNQQFIDTTSNFLFIIENPGIIRTANKKFIDFFGNPTGLSVQQFIEKHPQSSVFFSKYKGKTFAKEDKMVEIFTDNGEKILVDVSIITNIDCFGDIKTKVFILKPMYNYEKVMDSYKLSPQERCIVLQIANGLGNKEIAAVMRLSENTVRNYLTNIFSKTNATNRTELTQLIFHEKTTLE